MSEASADTSGAGGDVLEPTGPLDEFKLRETQVKRRRGCSQALTHPCI